MANYHRARGPTRRASRHSCREVLRRALLMMLRDASGRRPYARRSSETLVINAPCGRIIKRERERERERERKGTQRAENQLPTRERADNYVSAGRAFSLSVPLHADPPGFIYPV